MSREQLANILEIGAQFPPPVQAGPEALRGWFEAINANTPIPEGLMIERVGAGPAGGDLLRFANSDERRLIVYFHGGGFLFGSSRSHRVVAANLCRASGIVALAADYRLAPEHPAPAAHDDAFAVYRWALEAGYAPSAICLAGDSAGGNLALCTVMRARDQGLPLPGALALMSPALDFTGTSESARTILDAPLVNRDFMALFNHFYFGDRDLVNPTWAPLNGTLTGLPPTLIHVGSWELLRDDSVALECGLRSAKGEAELKIWDGMCHSWQLFAPMLEEGTASIEEAGAFAKARLKA